MISVEGCYHRDRCVMNTRKMYCAPLMKYFLVYIIFVLRHLSLFVCLHPPSRHITESPVTDQSFIENLHELDHKINFVKEQSFNDYKCCSDVKDILDKLKVKVS